MSNNYCKASLRETVVYNVFPARRAPMAFLRVLRVLVVEQKNFSKMLLACGGEG